MQLCAMVASHDEQIKFIPCDVWCKNDSNGHQWRWLSLDTSESKEIDLDSPTDYPTGCNHKRCLVYCVLVYLLSKVDFHYDNNSRQFMPFFHIPYTTMECEVQEIMQEELESWGDDKAKKIEQL